MQKKTCPILVRWVAGFMLAGWSAVLLELSEPMVKRVFEAGFLIALWFGIRQWRMGIAKLSAPKALWLLGLLAVYAMMQTLLLSNAGSTGDAVKTSLWLGLFLYSHAVALRYYHDHHTLTMAALALLSLKSLWIIGAIATGLNEIPYEGERLLENSNYVGGILAALWVFAAAKISERPSFLSVVALSLGFVALLLVGSRGALLALIVSSFGLALYRSPAHWRVRIIGIFTLAIAMLLFSVSQLLPEQWLAWVGRLDSFRLFLWAEAWKVFQQAPLFGLGWGAAFDVTLPYGAPAIHPHNMFIGGFVYGGLIGGGLQLFLFGMMGWQLARISRENLSFFALWAYGILLGMVDYGLFLPEFSVQWFWCWLPLAHLWQYQNRTD